MKDDKVHVKFGVASFAPCGVRVSAVTAVYTLARDESLTSMSEGVDGVDAQKDIHSSCDTDYSKITCEVCKSYVVQVVRLFKKATQALPKEQKWKEKIR